MATTTCTSLQHATASQNTTSSQKISASQNILSRAIQRAPSNTSSRCISPPAPHKSSGGGGRNGRKRDGYGDTPSGGGDDRTAGGDDQPAGGDDQPGGGDDQPEGGDYQPEIEETYALAALGWIRLVDAYRGHPSVGKEAAEMFFEFFNMTVRSDSIFLNSNLGFLLFNHQNSFYIADELYEQAFFVGRGENNDFKHTYEVEYTNRC